MIERLAVISPCRNEAKHIEKTIDSVVQQTRCPDRWIIVDDGSDDGTTEIVEHYSNRYSWIEGKRRERSGSRQLGPGVVEAFNDGLAHLESDPYEVVVKLDCDLEFAPDCFAKILSHFEDDRVGMASGTVYLKVGDKLELERCAEYHVPGQIKFYRRECFEEIGGLPKLYGWDILDETSARRHGWITLRDPEIKITHLRLQGIEHGAIRGRVIWGHGAYAIGSHPLFAIARGIYRMLERPWIIGGLALIYGFFSGYFKKNIKRNPDRQLIKYLRKEQIYRLFHGNRLPPGGD